MKFKTICATLCLSVAGVAFAGAPREGSSPRPPLDNSTSLARAEVRADLNLWVRAGMLPFADTESGPDTTNVNYRKAYARYLSLRNSTAQKGEVGQVAKYQG